MRQAGMRQRAFVGALLLVIVGVLLGATVFRTDIAQATGLAQSVTVNNTSAQAVPVREQNLDGGNIKVHEQGTVPVSVGTPAAPAEPYLAEISCSASSSDVCIDSSDPIPDGKRLVIQTLSAIGNADVGVSLTSFLITVHSNGQDATFELLGSATNTDGSHTFSAAESRSVTLYADAGTHIAVGVSASASSHINAGVDISGYLVPMPD